MLDMSVIQSREGIMAHCFSFVSYSTLEAVREDVPRKARTLAPVPLHADAKERRPKDQPP